MDFDEIKELVQNNPRSFTMIQNRLLLEYTIGTSNFTGQYVPPFYKDSNMFMELQAVALPKGSELEDDVNRWYF